MRNTFLCGDALAVLETLPSESVQCVVTSPPYYALRDYGVVGQIGLEETPAAYIARLVEVFREARRVLRSDGTCWVNMGDSYAHDDKWGGATGGKHVDALHGMNATRTRRQTGFKPKDLMLMPARLAIALQEDGWWLRNDIIWAKPAPMPESVTDRFTRAHEHVFLLAKSERYFFDAEAVKEQSTYAGNVIALGEKSFSKRQADGAGIAPSGNGLADTYRVPSLRNKRDVWTVANSGYPDAHFATFPPKLVEPCILAGSSPRACEVCGAPWKRVTEQTPMVIKHGPKAGGYGSRTTDGLSGTMVAPAETRTVGWEPSCRCEQQGTGRSLILDPFSGAGTVALVALQQGRDYLGIDLNPEYIQLAEKRIATIQPVLWS